MRFFRYLALLCFALPVQAVDPALDWQTLTTDHFEIHFARGNESLTYKSAVIAERAHQRLTSRLNWQPLEKTHLVISDETDQPNGYAMPFPFNRSVLFMAPPDSVNTLEDFSDWLELLITHEYTHVIHLDKVDGGPEMLRHLFGRHFLLFPNAFQPGWLTEGLATHFETNTALGIGRGQSSSFAMMMREEVAQGIKPVSQVNLPMRSWPMGTSWYLYGVHFYQFLGDQYGDESIRGLVDNYSYNLIPFMINTNSKAVLDRDITRLWTEYEAWLEQKYQPQIDQLQQQGLVTGQAITRDGYFTGEFTLAENGRVYYIRQGAFDETMLMMIDEQGRHHEQIRVNRDARIDINTRQDVLIAQPEICQEYNLYYDLYLLRHGENELQRLSHCGRFRSAAWQDNEHLVAVHIEQGVSSLYRINLSDNEKQLLWQGDNDTIISQPDISPDGRLLAAGVFRKQHGWNIELFDLETRTWTALTDDPGIDMYPHFSSDGSMLLFSSERNAVYNIYQLDLASREISALTRVQGGAFHPVQNTATDALYYSGYSAEGVNIYRLDTPAALTREILPIPQQRDTAAPAQPFSTQAASDYSPWPSLQPRWWFPWWQFTEDMSEIGITTSGNDALGLHNYALNIAWDTTNDYATGSVLYAWSNRFLLGAQRSTDIWLDTNSEFAVARQDDDVFAVINFPWTSIQSQWQLSLAAIGSESHDARRASGITPQPASHDNLLGLALGFNNSQHFIRSVSANRGRRIQLLAESSEVFSSDFSGEIYTLDWREYLPLGGQHVLALRLVEGYGTDQPDPFRLGGENTDFVLTDLVTGLSGSDAIGFGQREYPLRGYAEGHAVLQGRRIQLASAEWRFPLALVERGFMAPPVGLMQLAGSVFADNGLAWQDSPGKSYSSVGAELHADLNLFYGITIKTRLGFARGLDETLGDNRIYLSLGAAF